MFTHQMKKIMALITVPTLIFTMAGCSSTSVATSSAASALSAAQTVTPAATPAPASSAAESMSGKASGTGSTDGQKWIDSDVQGSVTTDTATDPTDDFVLYVNKDWDVAFNPENNSGVQILDIQRKSVRKLVTETIKSGSDGSHDAGLVSTLYNDTVNMNARNASGIKPVQKYVEAIRNISSMDELSAFISDSGNQLVVSPLMEVTDVDDLKDSTKKILYLMPWPLSLTDAAEYSTMTDAGKRTKAAAETMFTAYMAKFGMSREEAEKAYGELFAFETQLAGSVVPNADEQSYMMETDSYHIMSIDELSAECRNYPVVAVLKQYKDAGIKSFNNYQSKWLAKLDELYTSGNLENWKNVLLYNLMMENVNCLDEDCLKMFTEYNNTINGIGNAPDVEGSAYTNCNERLKWAVGKMYCDQYITADMKNNIKNMISEIIAVYRKRLEKADWLSEATRKKAVEKLDAIKIHAVYPDDWTPYEYTGLDFPSAEGDTGLFADMQAIGRYERNAMIKRVINPPKGDIWYAVPQEADAMYIPTQNSINITAGVLGDAFYDPKASESTNLGGIGEVIGHEITHAFDSSGSTFDKDGNMNDWWTDEDRAAFNRKTAKVSEYYAAFEPLSGYKVSGSMTLRETVADLGSYSCLMELAKTKPDFNYKEFFTNTAKMFRMQQSEIAEQVWLQQNPHPPYYLRVNVNLSMLQEFQDTYGVKAGDNMYVAAADRLSVW